jgi:type I restriction enzyme, R subunit
MSLHKEIAFEDGICDHLHTHGWLYETGAADRYDRSRALFIEDLVAWIKASQPQAWSVLEGANGAVTAKVLADRLRASLDKQGTLHILRNGLDVVGLKQSLALCQFKPALAMNKGLQELYTANRLRVVRQVHYSLHGEQSLDLVLFLNGIPVATAELKSDYTQSVQDAIDQYRYDRNPRGTSKNTSEPLLSFPGGTLVHFAVSNSEVHMSTRLAGSDSVFLPFNQGFDFGAGNPPNPNGAATAYLWKSIWDRDGWLEILGRYVIPVRNAKQYLQAWIFPRFHQLIAIRKLVAAVLAEGPGGRYLIQHSAGSGKTNSIAWTAHFLADLHNSANAKVFDTVIVVSDRTALDDQLQKAIDIFERTKGVVAVITGDGASKSKELADALAAGKKIVVCTIQTFPFAMDAVRRLAATKGKRFAVIADEAHSSQTGNAASQLKLLLTPEEEKELEDGGEVSIEDILAATIASRAKQDTGVTYVAFTATPKAKTLELFGRRPDPSQPAGKSNLPAAFDVYSMRQAIDEGFILDVLQNYTSYKLAFRLTHNGREIDEKKVDAGEARKGIMRWVRLHPVNIAARVQIVVEHFRQNVAHLLDGKAKAMVVTSSRREVVRWMKAMEVYIKQRGYTIGLLVAFSGAVRDAESGPDEFTEINMNPSLHKRDIRIAFDTPEFSILLVANKLQTGFDQPLLCAMYVDRKLGGIQAVQTLSRLNRAYRDQNSTKDATFVVDFVNEPGEILEAFRQYHATAELADISDPNLILDLRNKLDTAGRYDLFEVERVAQVVINPKSTQASLDAALVPVSSRLLVQFKEALKTHRSQPEGSAAHQEARDEMEALLLFKKDLGSFIRAYEFLGQMFDYGNTAYEKLYMFSKLLLPLLDYGREREGLDLSTLKLTHHKMRDLGQHKLNLEGQNAPVVPLTPVTESGSGQVQDKHKLRLAEIIQAINDLFEGDVTEGDAVAYVDGVLKAKLLESDTLRAQAVANTKEQFANSPSLQDELMKAIMDAMAAHHTMSKQALGSENVQAGILSALLGPGALWETLRSGQEAHRDGV